MAAGGHSGGGGGGETLGAGVAGEAGAGGQQPADECAVVVPGMVCVPGGTFTMGSVQETPLHEVTVRVFHIDRHETTVGEYAACIAAGVCTAPHPPTEVAPDCNFERAGRLEHPINCVDWYQATSFCAWREKRLPTEEEWEYAARYPGDRTYPWGDMPPDKTRLNVLGDERTLSPSSWGDDGHVDTAPVGSFIDGVRSLGIHDLAGNLWEWTLSPYCPYSEQSWQAARASASQGERA